MGLHRISLVKIVEGLNLIIEGLDARKQYIMPFEPGDPIPRNPQAKAKPKVKKSLMTIDEIADFMGVCKGVAYKHVRNGKLPKAVEKIGKSSYWNKKEVKNAIKEFRKNERRSKK